MSEDQNKENDGREYNEDDWKSLGKVNDAMSAGFAKETLESYNIPCVIFYYCDHSIEL